MNIKNILFSAQDKFKVIAVENQLDQLHIYVQSKQKNSVCPNCCMPSHKIHSYYTRTFHDLPAFGKASVLFLRSRRFYCLTDECALGVFSERFSTYFGPYKRRTSRLDEKLLHFALNVGGKPAERLCKQLSISISDTTLLRLIHNAPIPEQETLTAIGVDDWAYKKRDRYGSILVNLHTKKIIDLLPDREENTLRKWLKEMPGINIITRDRYGKYQKAAAKGAPQAQQVTDRWHLLKNLGEALRKVLDQEYTILKKARNEPSQIIAPERQLIPMNRRRTTSSRSQNRFQEVKILHSEGVAIKKIARRFKMSRITIRKYIGLDLLPQRDYIRSKELDMHIDYIKSRIENEPCLYIKNLWQELLSRGYSGAYNTLTYGLRCYGIIIGKKVETKSIPPSSSIYWRPSKTVMLFFKEKDKLSTRQQELLAYLCLKSTKLENCYVLIKSFGKMMKEKDASNLSRWIQLSKHSGIKEMASFAKGLEIDFLAIRNALTLPWSNGPVEGSVNKLKTIKRQMYGRASFELLRKRLVLMTT